MTLCAAIAILILGVAFKPGKKSARPLSESDLSRLQPAPAVRMNELSQQLADASVNAAPRLVYMQSAPHTAVLWDSTHAITPTDARGTPADWKPVPAPGGVPFAIFTFAATADTAITAPGSTVSIASGDWVLAVARTSADHTVFAEGIYQGISDARCGGFEYREVDSSAKIGPSLIGGGLFTADGKLLGVIALCGGEPVVVSAGSVAAVLLQPVFITDRLERDYGMRVSESDAGKQAGVVWNGGAADAAGVKAGDVIAQVDGRTVTAWSDLEPLEGGGAHTMTLRRGSRNVKVSLDAAGAVRTVNGLTLSSSGAASKVVVSEVARDSAAARANLQAGDVLLRVGGVAVGTPDAAARALTGHAGAVTVQIERGTAKADVVLTP